MHHPCPSSSISARAKNQPLTAGVDAASCTFAPRCEPFGFQPTRACSYPVCWHCAPAWNLRFPFARLLSAVRRAKRLEITPLHTK